MPFNVRLETRSGQVLSEITGMLGSFLPQFDNLSFPMLRLIDPYDDTVFNRLQAKVFLEEWLRLKQAAERQNEQRHWREVERIANECLLEPLRYVRFVGD